MKTVEMNLLMSVVVLTKWIHQADKWRETTWKVVLTMAVSNF
jgi:hypothetical protein